MASPYQGQITLIGFNYALGDMLSAAATRYQ